MLASTIATQKRASVEPMPAFLKRGGSRPDQPLPDRGGPEIMKDGDTTFGCGWSRGAAVGDQTWTHLPPEGETHP